MRLPLECHVDYHERFVSPTESNAIFDWICANCPGLSEGDTIPMANGTVHRTDIGKWMFVDQELTDYALFIKPHGRRMEWPPLILELRDKIERFIGMEFHVCVCLYYCSGEIDMGFHSDPPSFGPTSLIPSISLGEKRTFLLRNKSDHSDQYEIELPNGSLLIMGAGCQEKYEHAVPVHESPNPRINLTFRPFKWPRGYQRNSRIETAGL